MNKVSIYSDGPISGRRNSIKARHELSWFDFDLIRFDSIRRRAKLFRAALIPPLSFRT